VTEPDILPILLSGQTVSLASWFASPLNRQQAEAWLPKISRRTQAAVSEGHDGYAVRLAELVVRYWYGDNVDVAYKNMLALLGGRRQRAMLELCYGQLLIARKTNMAWQHLDCGFRLAAHIFHPEDYFMILKRHERLRALVLSARPSTPMRLEELLTEASVIQRLRGAGRGTHRQTDGRMHRDTTN
jgi:hypothetical protein